VAEAAEVEIDWITAGAQAVNFVVLVLLLRHFLYGRILEALDRREAEIRSRLDEAERQGEDARLEAERNRREREAMEASRGALLREAREEAEAERRERLEEIRTQAEQARERWRQGLRREREEFLRELRERVATGTWAMVRRILEDLADEELQRQVVRVFERRLREARDDEELRDAVAAAGELVVRTAFDLPPGERARLEDTLRDALGAEAGCRFETAPELVLGLRLEAGDREVQWTVRDQLAALEERVEDLLRPQEVEEAVSG
jgi:F-type H+-transporting ATPase subunit b